MSNSGSSATPVRSPDNKFKWESAARAAMLNKVKSRPEHGSITDKYEVANAILRALFKGMMHMPEDEVLIRILMTVISCSPDPRIKWRPYPEACVEFLQDEALKKALRNGLESGNYREVMSLQ